MDRRIHTRGGVSGAFGRVNRPLKPPNTTGARCRKGSDRSTCTGTARSTLALVLALAWITVKDGTQEWWKIEGQEYCGSQRREASKHRHTQMHIQAQYRLLYFSDSCTPDLQLLPLKESSSLSISLFIDNQHSAIQQYDDNAWCATPHYR